MHRRVLMTIAIALTSFGLVATLSQTAPAQIFSMLYNFGTQAGDPTFPALTGAVAQGQDGNFYSTTPFGGANNLGAAFSITPTGTVTLLHSFDSAQGTPFSGLTLGNDGNFYGTTEAGGTSGIGTVFRISPNGTFKVLHNFAGGSEGSFPTAPPVLGPDLNFYGTTGEGGGGGGTIYKMTPSGKLTTLHAFIFTDGYQPVAPLVLGSDGNFYGTSRQGGSAGGQGVAFKVTRTGKVTVLFNFDTTHGALPLTPLIQGSDGNFYGATPSGGTFQGGVIFKVTPTGKFTVLYNINGGTDGNESFAGLVQATDGNFYGVASSGSGPTVNGTIFKVTPAGAYSVLHSFDGTDGTDPEITLLQHTTGILYGATRAGGTTNQGVFYKLNQSLGPFVAMLPPLTTGLVGQTVQFFGQGFTGTTVLSFNGTPASFSVVSDTFLTAAVPNGAGTGSVTVKTPSGTLTSNRVFLVIPQQKSFAPPSGPVGSQVVITGVSLKQTTKVVFGTKSAAFTVNSDTQVTATVPAGAKTAKIGVTTPGGTAKSATSFTVTP